MLLTEHERQLAVLSLKSIGFLRGVSVPDLDRLIDGMTRRDFRNGETLVRQGEPGDAFFIVAQGSVDVFRRFLFWTRHVERMGTLSFFGELALLYGTPRTATVLGADPGFCFVLSRETFYRILLAHPPIESAIRAIAGPRWREANRTPEDEGPA